MAMTEFRLHLWSRQPGSQAPTAKFEAPSKIHGAALALREFTQLGYDVTAPGAHIDLAEGSGHGHTIMIGEVLDWLHRPEQAQFVAEQNLACLLDLVPPSRI